MIARFVVLTTTPSLCPLSLSYLRMRVVIVVVMLAERVAGAPSAALVVLVCWAVLLLLLTVVLVVVLSLSWSVSECEEGVDGKRELGATSVSAMPFDAACRAADLLSRYRLYSSPRTSGAAADDDEEEEEEEEGEDEREVGPAADLLDGSEAEALARVGGRAVAGIRAVDCLVAALLSTALYASTRA